MYFNLYKKIDVKSKYTLKNTENSKKMVKNIFSYVKKKCLGLLQNVKKIILRVPGPLKKLNYGLKVEK